MTRKSLDTYDEIPQAMRAYLSNFGFHFNKKAFQYAVSKMQKYNSQAGRVEKIEPYTKEQVDNMLASHDIHLHNNILYDAAFVANMAKADYLKSSIPDEHHLLLFVRDYLDDVDASDETAFRRWLATQIGNGEPVDFDDFM